MALIYAQARDDAVGDEGREVGQREQVAGHDERIAPRIGFALDHRERRQALRREHVPGEQRTGGGETPAAGDHRLELRGQVVTARGHGVHGAERAHRDFARRESRHQRDRDLPVETDGREDVLAAARRAGRRSCTGSRGRWRRRRRRDRSDRNHSTIISARMMPPTRLTKIRTRSHRPSSRLPRMRPLVIRQLEHQRRVAALRRANCFMTKRHDQRGNDAGRVQAEQHQALQVERADVAARE